MKKRGRIAGILILITLIVFSLSVLADDLLPLQGNVDLSGTPVSSGGIVVEIWDGPDVAGSNLIYNSTDNFTGSGNISSGTFDIVLGDALDKGQLNLEYGNTYYMDLYIAGNDMNFSSKERQIFMSSVGTINSSFLNTSNDYTMNSLLIDNSTIAVDDAYLNISDGVNPWFIVSPDGNVGIGTTAPAVKLNVTGTIDAWQVTVNGTAVSTSGGVDQWGWTNITGIIYTTQTGDNVGIGSISPTSILHLNVSDGNVASVTDMLTLEHVNSTGEAVDGIGSGILFRSIDDGMDVENISMIAGVMEDTSNASERGALVFYTGYGDEDGLITNLSSSEVMRITGLGRVGIGTINPGAKLEVDGTFNATGASATKGLYVDSNGRVGIGTTAPQADLHVEETDNGDMGILAIVDNTAGNVWINFSTDYLNGFGYGVLRTQSSGINLNMEGTNYDFTITGGATTNVGIGDTGPDANLEVIDDFMVSSAVGDENNGNLFTVTSEGKVGIGTNAPTHELNVIGEGNITGDLYVGSDNMTHPDYVFEPGYDLMSLGELKLFIEENKHLPNVEYESSVNMMERNNLLLEKTEELTLYILQQQEEIEELKAELRRRKSASE